MKDAPEVGGGPTTRSAFCDRSVGEEAPRPPVRPLSPPQVASNNSSPRKSPSPSPNRDCFGPGFGTNGASAAQSDQTEQLGQAMNLIAVLRKEVDALRGNFQAAETKCKRSQDRAKAAETRCDRLAQELRDAQRAKQKLEATVSSLRQKLGARQREESQTRFQIQDLQAGAEAMAQEHARQNHENMMKLRIAQEQLLALRQREVLAVCQNTMQDMSIQSNMHKPKEPVHARSSRPKEPRTNSTPPGMNPSRTHSSPPGINRSTERAVAMKAAAIERLDKVISATQAAMSQKAQERASPEKQAAVVPQKLGFEEFSSGADTHDTVEILTKDSMPPEAPAIVEVSESETRNRTPSFDRLEEAVALAEMAGHTVPHVPNSFSWDMFANAQSAVQTATDKVVETSRQVESLNTSSSSLKERSQRSVLDQSVESQFCPPPSHAPPDVSQQQPRFSNTPRRGGSPQSHRSRGLTPPRSEQNRSMTPPGGVSPRVRGTGATPPRVASPRSASQQDLQPREPLSRSSSRGVFSRLANTFTASTAHLREQANQPRSTTPKGVGFRRPLQTQSSRRSLGRDTVTTMQQLPTDGTCPMRTG